MKALVILFSIFLIYPGLLLAQTHSTDSAFLALAMQHQRMKYHDFIKANSSLYNGSDYKERFFNALNGGTPYFLSDEWIEGAIVYNGQSYDGVDLQYDIVNNKIVTHPFNSSMKIELVYDKIERFCLENHTFIKLQEISGTDNFYDQLVNGSVKLYALRKTEVSEDLNSGKIAHLFFDKTRYFVLMKEKLIPVRNKSDLFNVFPQHKNQIKKRLSEKKISFRKNLEHAVIESVLVYNQKNLN